MTVSAARDRMAATAVVFFTLFVVVLGRAVYLTVILGPELKELAAKQHQQRTAEPPLRGPIVDRNGEALALTVDAAAVFVHPREFTGAESVPVLARMLRMPVAEIVAKTASTAPFVWLDRQMPLDRWSELAAFHLQGVGSQPSRRRHYPHGQLAAHLLGFTNVDAQGIEGIELRYNHSLLSAVESVSTERDARGRPMMVNAAAPSRQHSGARVDLTIDGPLQHVAEEELGKAVREHQAEAGVAIVLDPRTGEILALANEPSFDLNDPAAAPAASRRNRVITDSFEPGSTFKIFTAAAALEAGLVKPEDRIYCENGSYAIGHRVVHDHERYGWLSFAEVIQHSSNIGTAKVGERVGATRLAALIDAFGFGKPTGVDLPGEVGGLLRPVEKWGRIHLVTTSFGQGIAVTPMQLVRGYAAIANGGMLLKPYVVQRVVGEDGRVLREQHPEAVGRVISPRTARTLTTLLERVVEGGTGTKANVEGFTVAGKTGTAQKVEHGHYSARGRMSSFIGYVPAEDPRLVILVVIDSPKGMTYGGLVAAPAFKRIAEYGLGRLGLRPSTPSLPAPEMAALTAQPVVWKVVETGGGMPSFLGLSMREALVRAHRAGWDVRIEGSGFVVAQDPSPGAAAGTDRTLRLVFGTPTL
ncbi:MAG: PASTA domain-containing protein [Deltaproteobacteria bacterium]|nr:PASTA domain-containing protein [Deltaproteobacteria bacterium]MBI3386861.1 PASTA domain-containing protein [Deltaproteobacteria bacterium]